MTLLDKVYIDKYAEKRLKRPLKIPRNLSQKILSEGNKFKAVCIWLELKPLFYNGQIENAKTKAAEIAHYLGISKRNYYKQIKKLKAMDLVSFDSAGTLFLSSWKKFFFIHGIDRPGRFKFYRLKNKYANDAKNLIRLFALKENLLKQEYAIEQKVVTDKIKETHQTPLQIQHNQILKANIPKEDKERISRDLIEQMERIERCDFKGEHKYKSKLRRTGILKQLLIQAEKNYYRTYHEFDRLHPVNFNISISCEGTAKLFGLKSRSSGHYWQRRLEKLGLMQIDPNYVIIEKNNHSFGRFIFGQQDDSTKLHHYLGKRELFKRLNNTFKFANLDLI